MTATQSRIRGGANDGLVVEQIANREYETLFSQAAPRLFDLARRGKIFTGNVAAAGVVLPIYSGTTQQWGLWNPVGSGVDLVLLRLAIGYVDTTGAAGELVLGYLPNAPAAIGTGLAITAFTETTSINAYLGGGFTSKAKFGQGATLTVTAPSVLRHLGLNQTVLTAATATGTQWLSRIEFEGDIILTPGTAAFVAGNIATLSKFTGSLTWAEIDR